MGFPENSVLDILIILDVPPNELSPLLGSHFKWAIIRSSFIVDLISLWHYTPWYIVWSTFGDARFVPK